MKVWRQPHHLISTMPKGSKDTKDTKAEKPEFFMLPQNLVHRVSCEH